jgi:hypothetical protein
MGESTKTYSALGDNDAAVENQNRFRLRRPSGRDLRGFYRIEGDQVLVDVIRRKRGNQLFISGRKMTL